MDLKRIRFTETLNKLPSRSGTLQPLLQVGQGFKLIKQLTAQLLK